jgi:hypothetical protein
MDRAGLKMGNKGFEAALAAVEMASLKAAIRSQASAGIENQARSTSRATQKKPLKRRPR